MTRTEQEWADEENYGMPGARQGLEAGQRLFDAIGDNTLVEFNGPPSIQDQKEVAGVVKEMGMAFRVSKITWAKAEWSSGTFGCTIEMKREDQ